MAPLLTVEKVTKQFANHKALDEVSLTVPQGSIYGLLGPNGAGKTTLIRIINQITGPDAGSVLFNGRELSREHIRGIGYLPEERGLYKKMKVGEQALYLAQLKGMSKHDALKNLKTWFEKFEIGSWWNRKVEELSKGMQQKVQFIVTVVHEPDLLIFDEPFSGFDPINSNLIKEEILELKARGATIIFSTHNMASVEELCDRITLIDQSKKILEGEVQSIKHDFRTHTYELSYVDKGLVAEELLGPGHQVISFGSSDNVAHIRIRSKEGMEKNSALKALLEHTEVLGYQELYPTINDIFIHMVNQNKPSKGSNHE